MSGLCNVLIIILLEGIVFFVIVNTVVAYTFTDIFNSISTTINNFINNSYIGIVYLLKSTYDYDITIETLDFQSLAIRLFITGFFSKGITDEKERLLKNDIISYTLYIILIVFICLCIGITYIIFNNYNTNSIYNSKISLKPSIYNTSISISLTLIFLLAVGFGVLVNIGNNINTNKITLDVFTRLKAKIVNTSNVI